MPVERDSRGRRVDLPQVVRRELDVRRAEIFFETVQLRGAGDRYDPRPLRQHPSERELRGVTPFRAAIALTRSTTVWFAFRFSGAKRGTVSLESNVVVSSIFPVRKPLLPRNLIRAELARAQRVPPNVMAG